jgi:hypothetical protein
VSRPVVAKLDARGTLVWENAYRKAGFMDFEGASAIEVDGEYIVYIQSYVHPARGSVARLVRLKPNGSVVWDAQFRGDGGAHTPHPQQVRLHDGKLELEGHIYQDKSDTAYGWTGTMSLEGQVLTDEVGAANPYE